MLDTFVPAVETLRKEYEGGTPAKEAMELSLIHFFTKVEKDLVQDGFLLILLS